MPLGYLCLVLHAHLPFVRHPEYDDFLEEDWLYEAITETYIPLLEVFDGLERDGADWRLTMSVTPTLAAMLSDPLLQYRYVRHIDNLIALAAKEIERTRWQPEFHHLAADVSPPLPAGPRGVRQPVRQQPAQRLPPFLRDRQAGDHHLRRDARLFAADDHQPQRGPGPDRDRLPASSSGTSANGRRASGCRSAATRPASTSCCATAGIRYFFTDTHGVLFAEPRPQLRRLCPDPLPQERRGRAWPATPNRPSRSGAPSRAIPAITTTAISTATSASISITSTSSRTCTRHGIRSHLGIKYYKITGRDRPQAALRPAGGAGQGGRACRQLHVQPREAGRMAAPARWTAGRR